MVRRSASANQLAALARGRAVLAMRRRSRGGAGSFGKHNLAAAKRVSPWSVSPKMCGYRKRTSRCFGRRAGKRSNKRCRISKVSKRCRKTAAARRASKSRSGNSRASLLARLVKARAAKAARR